MASNDFTRMFADIEVLKMQMREMNKEMTYKHERVMKDIEIVHKRIGKAEDSINSKLENLNTKLDKKMNNGNGFTNRVDGWSNKKRAGVGSGIGLLIAIVIYEFFTLYKGGL